MKRFIYLNADCLVLIMKAKQNQIVINNPGLFDSEKQALFLKPIPKKAENKSKVKSI